MAHRFLGGTPSHRMRVGQPFEKRRHLPIPLRMHDQMPVIPHQAVGIDRNGMPGVCLNQQPLKGQKVRIAVQQADAPSRPIQNMQWIPARSNPWSSCHFQSVA